jgi:acyl-CoA thioesterase I
MKKSAITILILIIVLGAWFFLRNSDYPKKMPTAGTRVIAFGDSLVAGEGASRGDDFVSELSRRLGLFIINAGVPGDTTETALLRLDRDVLARDPKVVLVLLGGNDAIRRIDRAQTFQNLDAIVARIHARGAAVVLIGIQSGLLNDRYDSEFEDLARRNGAWLVPDILNGIIGQGELMSDTIHPNSKGYEIMADRIEPVLREVIR